MLIEFSAIAIGKAFYDVNKSLKMDEEAKTKYSKAFTREYEAQQLVEQKKNHADTRLQNVAKKKKSVITVSLPMFVELYKNIQDVSGTSKERSFEVANLSDIEKKSIISKVEIISKKPFTDKELVVGTILKGIPGMIIEDSKRNLSAARSMLRASNVVCEQAKSISEIYDAISERADRISKLIATMNMMFLEIISATRKIIDEKKTGFTEHEKGIIVSCVNMAVAMTQIIDIPVLDEKGELAEAAKDMIITGEEYINKINMIMNERGNNYETNYNQ